MKITINGQDQEVQEGVDLAQLVQRQGLNPQAVIVERNLQIVQQEAWSATILQQGDQLEILAFVGGG